MKSTDTLDHSETMQDILLSHEKVFVPSSLKEKCSSVAVCFDGTKFTCGFDGCGSTYKNARGMQKHLRKVHPYHFKPKKVKTKDLFPVWVMNTIQRLKSLIQNLNPAQTQTVTPDEGLDHRSILNVNENIKAIPQKPPSVHLKGPVQRIPCWNFCYAFETFKFEKTQ